jgi:hypothetical protein
MDFKPKWAETTPANAKARDQENMMLPLSVYEINEMEES